MKSEARASRTNGTKQGDRGRLEAEILAWMGESDWKPDATRFDALALALFRFQYGACVPYRRYCDSLGRDPESVASANSIPARSSTAEPSRVGGNGGVLATVRG